MATLRDFAPGYEQATFTSLVPDYADEDGPLPTRYGPDMSGYDAKAELDNTSELGKGYKSTRLGLEASYLAAEESSLRAKGNDEAADLLVPRRLALEERAGLFAPKEQSAYDLKDNFSLRRGADWAAGAVGGMGASLVDSMATGVGASALARGASTVGTVVAPFTGPAAPFVAGASRLLGAAAPYIGEAAAFVPNYLQAKGATVQAAWKDPELMARTTAQERDDAASLSGVGQAALDTLIPGAMRRRMMGENLYGAAERGLNRLPLAAGVALDSLGEGAQEVVQDRMEKAALSHLNPDRDTSGDWRDTIDNFAAGAVGSAPMAAGSRYMGKGRERLGAEGDGKNGDGIDLNAPDEKPPTTLESLNGGKSRFNKRAEAEALVAALEGHEEDPAKIPEAAARQKSVLMEELSKLKGKEAEEHLQKVSGISVDDPLDAIENLGAPEFLDAAKFVMQKLHITNAELARMKNNAERELIRRTPEDEAFRDRMNEIVRPTRQEQAIDKRAKRAEGDTGVDELRTLKPEAVDPSAFKFELDPSHFLAPTETGATGKTINERAAANRARLEQAQNKAKVFNARAELVANKLWNAYTDEHGYEVDAEGALEPSRIRQGDPQAVGIIRELAQELTAAATVTTPTPSEERRAQRLAEQLVQTVGTKAVDVLTDINRITGSTMALKGIVSAASSYLGATNSSALKVQHETRDAAAVELTKLIPAEIEMRLAKDHGVDLSSNKDRNDLLDLMEDVADGRTSVPRIKLNKLFSKPVVDAMEEYLGKAIMPRLEGVKEDHIDENDDYGSKTQTGNTEGEHNTEQSLADPRDLTSDGEVTEFDQRQLGNNLIRVKPDSLVFHVSGDKRGSMVKFSDAWKENDDGRLPKLIHPGDGRTLEHVQKLVAKATERLGPEQRDRYVMGNPASKDPLEAAGATSAKKILDDSNVPDDQRLKLMMRYMEQEGKTEVPGEVTHAISSLNVAERASAYINSVLGKRESLSPSGETLSVEQNAKLNATRGDLDAVLSVAKKSSKYSELAAMPDLGARMAAMVPIVKSAVETARESLARNVPGYQEFAAKNPNADLKDYVNDFFSQRYAVVAEQPTDRDYLQMNLAEFNDMAKKGVANLNSAWVTAGDNEAEQAKVKAGMNIIHFKSRHSGTGEVAIPAYKLVKWVREQENAHTDDKRENDTGSGSPNAQYDSYLDALKQGITALHMGGLTEGLPWIMNAKGEREEFSPADTKGEPVGGTVDDFGTRWAPTKSDTRTFTDDFGDRVTSLGSDKNYSVGKEMSYRKAGKTEVENGWVRTGLGDLPPSLDVGGISYADYKRSKAYGAMHKRGAASSEAVHNRGLIDAKAEEAKNAELSQDEKDVQGEEAVDEAMAIDQGSRTREEERKHLKLMSSVMRAAADHLPKALTVGAAVNKAGKVAEQLWRDYAADREAGLERIFGYVRSMRRPASDDGYEYNKALGELWREFHAADDSQDVERGPGATRGNPGDTLAKSLAAAYPDATPEHLSDLLSRGVQAQNDPQGRGAVDTATTDNAGNIQKAIAEKAAEPKGAGHWGVGGIQYAFPLAALLTPRNIANANPADQATFKRLRSVVAAEIIRAALPDPKTPKLPPVLGTGQVRKLVNFMSGYNDQQKTEKLDKAKPPGDRALLERSKLAPVATSFVPNGGMKRFLQGLVDPKQGDIDLFPQANNTFEGENRTAAPLVRGFTTYERERAAENFINAAREYGIVTEAGHLRVTRPEAVKKLFAMTGAKPEDVNHMLGVTEGKSDAGVKPIVPYSRGEGATLAEREAARAEPVASVAGGRSAAKNVSLDYKGETIDHDAEIAALEAEYTARGIPNARGVSPILGDTPMPSKVETKEPSKVAAPLLKNPPKAPARYQAIETAKLAGATHVIAPVSAGDYSGYLGRAAQAEGKRFSPKVATDMTGKVVLVSVPGGNKGSAAVVAQIIEHVKMALDRGAIVRTDIERIATSAYNAEGEGVLRKALIEGGYAEKPGEMYSEWVAPSKVGAKETREVGTKEPSKVASPLLKNPPKAPGAHQPKETAKLLGADRAIAPISPEGYAGDLGRAAQAEGKRFSPKVDTDMTGKVVVVSVPGKGRGFTGVDKIIEHVKMALDRGATVRTDSGENATSTHNAEGEGVLRQALIDGGYTEAYTTEHFSAWQRVGNPQKHTPSSQIQAPGATKPASVGVGSQNALATAIAKHQEYLKNPPEDYTTERAAAIGTWAAKQHARVVAELAKTDDSTDQYDRLDELRFKLDQLGKASAAKVAESTEAEEHERKYGPQVVTADPSKDPEAMSAEKPPELSKAEIATLDKFVTNANRTNTGKLALGRRREVLIPSLGGAVRRKFHVVDEVNRSMDTYAPEWTRILNYVLGKDNWHTEWSSMGDNDVTAWVVNDKLTSTAEEILDRLELLVRNNLDKLSSEARERVERLWAGEKDLLNPEQRAKATLATKVEERNGLAQRLKDAEYQVSYRRAKYESNRTDRVLERISREALEREETDRGEISKKLAEIDAEIAALEAKLGPQGGAPSAVKDFDSYVAKGYYSQWYKDSVSKVGKEATDKLSDIIRQYRLSQIPELAGANIAADRSTVENIPDNVVQKLAAAAPGLFGRVMVGNHGVYVEYTPSKRLDSGRGALVKEHLQYTEYKHRKGYKIYEQTKGVNYADYRVGMGYIAVDEILGGEPQGAVKRNAEDTTVEPKAVAAALVETRDIMRMMGFKTAPAQFVNVAEKLLTDPDQDLAGFIKDSAKALSHVLTGETNFEAIREALSSTDWAIERAKIVAKLVKQGMMRGDAMVESYRVLTEMALTGELAVRTAEEKRGIAKLMQMVRELVAKFKRMVGSAEFADVVRGMLNKAIEEANTPLKLKEGFKQVSFQEAVDGDPTSAAVLAHVSTNPNVTLTGSIVLAAGGTIYRNAKNMLHDLDLLVRGSKADAEAHLREAFPDAVQVYDFKTSNGKVDTFIVPPKGATVEDITRAGNTPGKGRIQGFRIVKDGKEIGRTWHDVDGNEQKSGVTGTLVDFFTEIDTDTVSRIPFTVGNKRYQIGVASVGHIFDAKLAIHRDKDINDYKRFVPNVGDEITKAGTKLNAEALTEKQAAAQFDQLSKMSAPPPKHIQVTSAIKYFERTLGDKVNLILKDSFPDMKIGGADYNLATNVARIATANPLRIMRLTYHEGVHAFFNTILNAKGMEKTKELMYRVASDPKVYNRVKELLKGETEALADMERDPEERVAYMFQFYKLGLLDIDHAPKTFFEKVQALMRRVFGAVRDSEKALAIFTAFDQGQLKETSAAGRVIEKIMGRGEWRKEMLAKYDKQAQALYTEVMANHLNFRNSESATAKLLGRMWYSNPAYGADTEQVNGQDGVINRTKFKRDYYSNRIRVALKPLQGPNLKRDLETLAEALNNHTEPTSAILRKAKKDLHAILTEYRDYARQAGLDIGFQIGADGEYWARVYEIEKLINGREGFVNMLLTKHGKLMTTIKAGAIQAGESGITTERDVAEMIHQSLIDRLGVHDSKLKALREDGVLSPFFASMNERTLEWLSDEDVAPYLSKDVIGTMTQYISQGVRAAEYTRTFGEGGMGLKDMLAKKGDVKFVTEDGKVVKYEEDGPIRRELVEAAEEKAVEPSKREEWVERRMEDLKRASGAMEGSLGKDISATARKLQAGAMTYQILRLLPLMIFSSMLDANGIRVAGGEWEDMFNAYKRGFAGLWNNWKDLFLGNPFGMRDPDDMEKAALASGVINSDMENDEMGEVHSSEYSSGLTRHINHVFFKAIGITQWDRDMRIVATDAARKAIVRDYNNAVPEHSARWLRELGLKKSDIYINDKGQLVVSAAELMKMKNIKDVAVAQKLLAPTHSAVNRWVNRAIVSPNAGLRPTRASDPHFAMFFQFKSFTYAFQETTMRYAMHEAEHGNFSAAARLLHGVPIMIASDMMKAMVTGGGSMPGYMANWTLVDWIGHGINRSGIGGTSTFLTDMLNGNVVGTLAGPTIDHAVGVAGDLLTGDVGGAITQSLPGVKQLHFLRP